MATYDTPFGSPQDLFHDESVLTSKQVTMHALTSKELSELQVFFHTKTVKELTKIAAPFLDFINIFKPVVCTNGKMSEPEEITIFRSTAHKQKTEYTNFLAFFLTKENFIVFFRMLDPRVRQIWHEVATNLYISTQRANEIMGEPCLRNNALFRNKPELIPALSPFFSIHSYKAYDEKNHKTGKKAELKQIDDIGFYNIDIFLLTRPLIPPVRKKDITYLDELPAEENLLTYSGEDSFLPQLSILYMANSNIYGVYRTGLKASINQLAEQFYPKEFFPHSADPKLKTAATMMGAALYDKFIPASMSLSIDCKPIKLLEKFIHSSLNISGSACGIILPRLKKVCAATLNNSYSDVIIDFIVRDLYEKQENGWIPIELIFRKHRELVSPMGKYPSYYNESKLKHITIFTLSELEKKGAKNDFNNVYIRHSNIISNVVDPFYKGIIFMMSLMGLVEIAYTLPDENAPSCYSGLRYVRVTDLFRYVFGIIKSYTPPISSNHQPTFTLDPDRLLLTSNQKNNPATSFMNKIGKRISPSIYKVDFASFIQNCTSSEQIKQRLEMFKQFISQDIPENWKEFLNQVEARSQVFEPTNEPYLVFDIPHADKEFQRLVLTAPDIRPYVLKGEGFTLVVKTSNIPHLKRALKKYGYLL